MSLKPLFLPSRIVNTILAQANEQGVDYWNMFEKLFSEKKLSAGRVPRSKQTKPKTPSTIDAPLPFVAPPKAAAPVRQFSDPPTVIVEDEEKTTSKNNARATCNKCGCEVLLPREELIIKRSRGRKIYCAAHTPTTAQVA